MPSEQNLKALEVALAMGAQVRFCRRCGNSSNPLFPVTPFGSVQTWTWNTPVWQDHASLDEKFAKHVYWCSVCISDHNGELTRWDFMHPLAPTPQ